MRVLIVDDDEVQLERYGDSIEAFNREHEIEVRAEYRDNFDDGLRALSQDYDGAVIDLKLSEGNEAEGNVIIREIKKNKRFPVCVKTGYPGDLDPDLHEEAESGPNLFFWVERRDRPFREVLERLATVYRSGVVDILGPHGVIERSLHEIFWTHLAKTLSFWNERDEPDASRKHRLVRFTLSHLLSRLEINEEGYLDGSYPDEMYVIPPFREEWQTGDIVRPSEGESCFVILTPSCDLAQNKAKSIQIIEVESFRTGVMLDKLNSYKILSKKLADESTDEVATIINQKNKEQAYKELSGLAGNSYANRYHFLPPCQAFEGGLLNFQKVNSIRLKEFTKSYRKLGTIAPGFLKDIVARFATYYARQGQPSFECNRLIEELLNNEDLPRVR